VEVKMDLEQIMCLKRHVGSPVAISVQSTEMSYIRYDEDREESHTHDMGLAQVRHILDNIYVSPSRTRQFNNPYELQFISVGSGMLVPFHYNMSPVISIRKYAEDVSRCVIGVSAGNDEVCFDGMNKSILFNGYDKISFGDDTLAADELQRYPKYPLLAAKGCVYVPETHAIIGRTENLLEGLRAIW
jgi:hypothetical protein